MMVCNYVTLSVTGGEFGASGRKNSMKCVPGIVYTLIQLAKYDWEVHDIRKFLHPVVSLLHIMNNILQYAG